MMFKAITKYLQQTTSASSLSLFRVLFGFLMLISLIRFWSKGWIKELYLEPLLHFSYYGFEWVKPLGSWTYFLFVICIIASFFICVGFKYRFSIIVFFLSFTYIELMDKTTYLNHYYFVSVLSFLMIFLPANASFSLDNFINKTTYSSIPKWSVDVVKLLISLVYVYAAIAKINSDWLYHAEPLKTWLIGKSDYYFIGYFFSKNWVHYAFSWFGLIYDLIIPFLLLYHRTRLFAFSLVVLFHVMTKILFPIGMFPYIMIFSAIIFFSPNFHEKVMHKISLIIQKASKSLSFYRYVIKKYVVINKYDVKFLKPKLFVLVLFFLFQIVFPFRYLMYPGELLWHEQGYRFSWRVMLVEKTGFASFKIVNSKNKKEFFVFDNHEEYLTPLQIKQMSFQPDFILEYAHFLGDVFVDKFDGNIEVYCDSRVALNQRLSQPLINDTINLLDQKMSFKNKKWILPLNDEIKGF